MYPIVLRWWACRLLWRLKPALFYVAPSECGESVLLRITQRELDDKYLLPQFELR